MLCPNCGSGSVHVQAVAENKKRGCFMAGLWILLAICTCGLILLIPLLVKKGSKIRNWAVCQSCGYRWQIKRPLAQSPNLEINTSNEPRFETLAYNVQSVLNGVLKANISISENRDDWTISKSGLKYTVRSKVKIDGIFKNALVELVFPNSAYESFSVARLQIDGIDIEY